ncbi:MAG: CFI-box-CTERM domain-containing protein [Vicinamibacterales bacterium]
MRKTAWRAMRPPSPQLVSLVLVLAALFAPRATASAARLSITWEAPTTREDGTPLDDLTGYRLYYGASSTGASSPPCNVATLDVDGADRTGYELEGLDAGARYYLQVTARDASGEESACSNEASGVTAVASSAPDPTPSPPTPTPVADPAPAPATPTGSSAAPAEGGGGGGGCFIATAAFASPDAVEVSVLRQFRDRYLLASRPGRLFVRAYYRVSPALADWLRQHEPYRIVVREGLRPIVWWAGLTLAWPAIGLAVPGGLVLLGPLCVAARLRRGRR